MTDIVERLRKHAPPEFTSLVGEAADEIERLRKLSKSMLRVLDTYDCGCHRDDCWSEARLGRGECGRKAQNMCKKARAALEGK